MRKIEIENWALTVIEQINKHQPHEDSRVELKADWIEAKKAARRIAGHANAAMGDSILWVIGVDEEQGVQGVHGHDFATWWEKVQSEFDGQAPDLTEININLDENKTVVALLFETDRAPYVVKNPSGGAISYEVPWRDGTTIRTAKRADLIRLLVPVVHTPQVEVLGGELVCYRVENAFRWNLIALKLYVEPTIGEAVVFPYHRCTISFQVADLLPRTTLSPVKLVPIYKPTGTGGTLGSYYGGKWEPDSITVQHTDSEAIITGPGRVDVKGETTTVDLGNLSFGNTKADIKVELVPSYAGDRKVSVRAELPWKGLLRDETTDQVVGRWSL